MDSNYFNVEELKKDITLGIAKPKDPFNESVLIRIQKGLLKSKFTPIGIKNFCYTAFNFS